MQGALMLILELFLQEFLVEVFDFQTLIVGRLDVGATFWLGETGGSDVLGQFVR